MQQTSFLLCNVMIIIVFLAIASVSFENPAIHIEESIGSMNICVILTTVANIRNEFAVYFRTEAVTATGTLFENFHWLECNK